MRILLSTIFILIVTSALFAQKKKDVKKQYYKDKYYATYVEINGKSNLSKKDQATLAKLGDSYRKIGDSKNAELVYALLLEKGEADPIYHYYYGQALQQNGMYQQARYHFKICDDIWKQQANGQPYDDRAKKAWRATYLVGKIAAVGEVKVKHESKISSEKYDFSPMFFEEGIVFVSTRENDRPDMQDRWLNDNYMDLYYAPIRDDGELLQVRPFSDEINSKYHEGPITFTGNLQRTFFTRSNYNKGKKKMSKDGTTKLSIFGAKKVKGVWADIEELPFCDNEFDDCHPALAPNERIMVFASNREGGFGKMDLYATHWIGESWTEPVNLGPEINSAGDDVFPYIHPDGTLFYSSDGGLGFGGLDIFMATQINYHPDSLWEYSYNVGAPFNSEKDDFGFILSRDEKSGFFSSGRDGGRGEDDIYSFKIPTGFDDVKPLPLLPIHICVFNVKTRERVSGAELIVRRVSTHSNHISAKQASELGSLNAETMVLSLTPKGEDQFRVDVNDRYLAKGVDGVTHTDNEGRIKFKLRAGDNYIIEIKKDGYLMASEYFTMIRGKELDIEEYCTGIMPLLQPQSYTKTDENTGERVVVATPNANATVRTTTNSGPMVSGTVYNKEYSRPLRGAKVSLLNRCTGDELEMVVGDNGTFSFPLECGCEFVVKARKNRFIGDNKFISLLNEDNCHSRTHELYLTPGFDRLGEPISVAGTTITESIKEGDVIQLKKIYYDVGKYNIRSDAAQGLDELAAIMRTFPSMEIELSSHTDVRSTTAFNQTLSENRANSARDYLISKGINASRIKAMGYGESRPKIRCSKCTEEEHQINRRTEVLVTKFDKAEYYQIIYSDNKPGNR